MLQPASHNALDRDVLCLSGDSRPKAADPANKEFHLNPRLGAFDQLFHDLGIVHGVALDGNVSARSLGDFTVEILQNPALEAQRSNPERVGFGRKLSSQQCLEGRLRVLPRLRIRRDQGEIGVLLAGNLVVVSGPHLGDRFNISAVLAGDQAELGVHLVLRQPVDDPAARVLQHLGIVDVVLFVKAGPQLQQAENVLPLVRRIGQSRGDLAAGGHAVEGDLDGEHLRVVRRLIDQIHKGHHALEGEAHQQVVLFDIAEILALLQADLPRRLPLFIAEVFM